ncbi:MAG: hypothetical protein OXC57_09660 [Rhodobacteraceae bacterium]|nr:hypothetical protein [Paracoccaceae bacterium]
MRRRRHHIHHLRKGAGIPHACIGDLQTIPMHPSRNRGGLLAGIDGGKRIEAEAV